MTHDDILKAARERIGEIDKQTTALAEERGKLQAMLSPTRSVAPLPIAPPLPAGPGLPWHEPPWRPLPEVTWTLGSGIIATSTTTYASDVPSGGPLGAFPLHDASGDLVIGGKQRPGSDLRYSS